MYPWGDDRRYNSYAAYFRRHFGERVQKVAINAGFTCPNRDGKVGFGVALFATTRHSLPPTVSPQKASRNRLKRASNFIAAAIAPHRAISLIFSHFQTHTHHSKYCANAISKHSRTLRLWG